LAVANWRARFPDVFLRVVEKVQVELILGLLRCEFDFVVGQTEFYDFFFDGLKQRVLFRDRLCIFVSGTHPLLSHPDPSWTDLAKFPWVCSMIGGTQRGVLETLFSSQSVDPPRQLTECGSIDF